MSTNPLNVRYPFELRNQPPEIQQAHRYAFQGILDLNQAIKSLKSQIDSKTIGTVSVASASGGGAIPIPSVFPFPGLGGVNDQTGVTAYTTVTNDNGVLLILNDASPVAVTLNSSISAPYFFFSTNGGTGTVTLTPTSGLINGAASWVLPEGGLFMVVFDGVNWLTSDVLILAQTIAHVTHKWLDSYDAATGLFTASQPDFSDISGNLATSQLPTAGLSVTITTAALTGGGTQGSMSFTNGILTAQTPAT